VSQPTTVVATTPAPSGDTGTAFAAGAATVVAATAAEQAQQAELTAESARRTADGVAERIDESAENLHRRISDLQATVEALQDTVAGLVTVAVVDAAEGAVVDDPNVPDVVVAGGDVVVDDAGAQADAPKPAKAKRERGFGSDRWFGSR